jgi:hypothetical protein
MATGILVFDFELLIVDRNLSYPDIAEYVLRYDPDTFGNR